MPHHASRAKYIRESENSTVFLRCLKWKKLGQYSVPLTWQKKNQIKWSNNAITLI